MRAVGALAASAALALVGLGPAAGAGATPRLGRPAITHRARGGIPGTVRSLLLRDVRSMAAEHRDRSPYDIQAVLTTERRARRLEDQTRPGRQRLTGATTQVYFIAMKGRFAFLCNSAASRARHERANCQRPPVLMLMVSLSTMKVIPSTGWGERYPDLKSVGVPVRLAGSRPCLRAPVQVGSHLAPDSGHVRLKEGEVVYVELIEPERYASPVLPAGFPWAAPVSSNGRVLAAVTLCPARHRRVATLPLRLYAFRAMAAGKAKLTAPLAPAWQSLPRARRGRLHAYRVAVTVTR